MRGDVTITGAISAFLGNSIVRGSATLNNNTKAEVAFNTIGVNLTCAGNGPGSDYLSNTVGGANNCPAV